ncbi:hypothetical protein E3Q19_00520 [Wallemia mellicola]|nr:hypothetical protein E3Q19_00520 [Wallemia mellicola]TIC33164.1 hypothetical protein E3Q11_00208 [Wallemia mellicola]
MSFSNLKSLIKTLRQQKTLADERSLIQRESAAIRTAFREEDHFMRHANVAKLIYIHMLGYPAHFGQIECLKLAASSKFSDKRLGYLGIMLLLDESQEVLTLVTNSLKNDMNHPNMYVVGLALATFANISSEEMARDLAQEVEKLLSSNNSYIRKKAALCAMRTVRKLPELHTYYINPAKSLLSDRNHGVLLCAVTLVTHIALAEPSTQTELKKAIPLLIRNLKTLITQGYSPEHDVSGITDPFLQIKILQLLRLLCINDAESSEMVNDILAQVATNTDNSKNVGNSILYEAVLTILDIEAESGLRVMAINILGKFLGNKDNNIRYVALNTLNKVVGMDTQAVQRHRNIIIDCLRDGDVSIRRRALELSYALINQSNVKVLTRELLSFLEVSDNEFKNGLTAQISFAAERFAPNKRWHIDTILRMLKVAGNYVREEVLSAFIRLVSHTPELQAYTVQKLYSSLLKDVSQEALTLAGVWMIGEFGEVLLANSSFEDEDRVVDVSEKSIVDLLESINVSPYASTIIRQYVLVAAAKLSMRFGKSFSESQDKLRTLITMYETSPELELQQRSIEFTQLLGMPTLVDGVLERMPPPEIRTSMLGGTASESKPVGSTRSAAQDSSLVDIMGEDAGGAASVPSAGVTGNAHDLLADIFGTGSPAPETAAGAQSQKSSVNDIMGLFGQQTQQPEQSATGEVNPTEPTGYTAYDANGLLIVLTPSVDTSKGNIVNIKAMFTSQPTMSAEEKADSALRKRTNDKEITETFDVNADQIMGKTPDGTLFNVPPTSDVISSLFHPKYPKTHVDIVTLTILGLHVFGFFVLPFEVSQKLYLGLFMFWRLAYNVGLGIVLSKQSKHHFIVNWVKKNGFLDANKRPKVRTWVENQIKTKMGPEYKFDECPVEFNTWIFFRHAVDIILLSDFVAYCCFAWSHCRLPDGHGVFWHALRWFAGWTMILFNLWVKMDAHRVIHDYAWYWGDVFFQQIQSLKFDGVFELAPHPMYSIGYAGFYGLSLVVGSYTVLFGSLLAHALQFGFLLAFENPHIERTYGQKKPLAARVPLPLPEDVPDEDSHNNDELEDIAAKRKSSSASINRVEGYPNAPSNLHDLEHRYFSRDLIIFKNFDIFRSNDFSTALLVFYAIVASFLPNFKPTTSLVLHVLHAAAWRIFHSFALGCLLKAQSENKYLVKHYLKYYAHVHADDAKRSAFDAWKRVYNLSLVMVYVSFVGLAYKTYDLPVQWTVGTELLKHTVGALLIALQVWCALESHEVLGNFGWFFGNFFLEDYPSRLEYTGIYRYVNDPERSMGGAALFGIALISGSPITFAVAVFSYILHWWFLSFVENPHTQKLYGKAVRKTGGAARTIKNAVKSGRRRSSLFNAATENKIDKVAKDVQGHVNKVYDETVDVVEEFIKNAKPSVNKVVQDTRVLLHQSREKLVITRVDKDLSAYDLSKYSINLKPSISPRQPMSYHLGESIQVEWTAPVNHSRKDWIGVYRVGANKDHLVTRISSQGKWQAIHEEEFDGARPVPERPHVENASGSSSQDLQKGIVTFRSNSLPWNVGRYEFRYHHAGKHNVMASCGPIEIFVDKPTDPDGFEPVRNNLSRSVAFALDCEPTLVPSASWHHLPEDTPLDEARKMQDEDDMVIMNDTQAKRIALAIKEAHDVDFTPAVIIADANLSRLTQRVLDTRRVLGIVEHRTPAVTDG